MGIDKVLLEHVEEVKKLYSSIYIPVVKESGSKLILLIKIMETPSKKYTLIFSLIKAEDFIRNIRGDVDRTDTQDNYGMFVDATTTIKIVKDQGRHCKIVFDNLVVKNTKNKYKFYGNKATPVKTIDNKNGDVPSVAHREKSLSLTFSPAFDSGSNDLNTLKNHFSGQQEYQLCSLVEYLHQEFIREVVDYHALGTIINEYFISPAEVVASPAEVVASYDFKHSVAPGDLQQEIKYLELTSGETYTLLKNDKKGWLYVSNSSGEKGYVPVNHFNIVPAALSDKIILRHVENYGSKKVYFDYHSIIVDLYYYWLEYTYLHQALGKIIEESSMGKNTIKAAVVISLMAISVTGVGLLGGAFVGLVGVSGPFVINCIMQATADVTVEGIDRTFNNGGGIDHEDYIKKLISKAQKTFNGKIKKKKNNKRKTNRRKRSKLIKRSNNTRSKRNKKRKRNNNKRSKSKGKNKRSNKKK
jgi:hypothetical protein